MANTVDLRKENPELYIGKPIWAEVKVPKRTFIAVSGKGSPQQASFGEAIQALYSVAYTLKFTRKKAGLDDFKVMPLEALWQIEEAETIETAEWVALIPLPDFVTEAEIKATAEASNAKKPNPSIAKLELKTLSEGLCLQYLHAGQYSAEPPVIADMFGNVLPSRGFKPNGWHHEIYLGDPNRTAPEKLKTLLRIPVAKL
ncbi:MAG: hypothetical protein RL556_751 [Actinomycetota bacterium]|jgi:hypothetical protein